MADLKMPQTNLVIIAGRITHEIDEPRKVGADSLVLEFTIANDDGWGDRKKTNFIRCVAWGNTAKLVYDYAGKGRPVLVEGKIVTEEYTPEGGKAQTKTKVRVFRVDVLDWPEKGGETRRQAEIPEDDIPF